MIQRLKKIKTQTDMLIAKHNRDLVDIYPNASDWANIDVSFYNHVYVSLINHCVSHSLLLHIRFSTPYKVPISFLLSNYTSKYLDSINHIIYNYPL